ncbi:MAG: hypothetical protein QM647_15060 [Asticcacaulis sp.]|uniref:hypothetical protein n=1 Tax=Asticcacaulis sp. TaxID=1872648 RepID=UPI0039E3A7A8
MSITLPELPDMSAFTPTLVTYSNDLSGPLGGPTQRLLRMGDRWKVAVTLAPLPRLEADAWAALLIAASRDTAVLNWPQPEGGAGSPGTPVVYGAGQSGMTLTIGGLTAGYMFRAGQMISFITDGRRYSHMVMTGVTVASNGRIGLSILPLLRVSPADGDTVEVEQPSIEGLIDPDGLTIPYGSGGITSLGFTLTEQK